MPAAQEHINTIQDKLSTLIERYNGLLKENERLKKSLNDSTEELQLLREKNDQITLQLNMLKVAASEESKESRNALEKKINEYIKEIDKCIAQLGDQH
jgi:chromosome segregation ATPase